MIVPKTEESGSNDDDEEEEEEMNPVIFILQIASVIYQTLAADLRRRKAVAHMVVVIRLA